MIYTLYKMGIKSYFRNKTAIFWSFGFVLVWIFIYAFAFPTPDKTDLLGVEASYMSFIFLFGVSVSSTSIIFSTISMNLSIPYITRFDKVKSYEVFSGNLLSSMSFGFSVAIFAVMMSLVIFKLRFNSINIKNIPMFIIIITLVSIFYIILGIIMAYIFTLLRQIKAVRFAGEIPMILVFVFVLGLQIFREPSKNLVYYSPFNEEFTMSMYSILGKPMLNYYNFTLNVNLLLLSFSCWIVSMALIAIILEKIYEHSAGRNQYTLEDVFR